MIPQAGINRYQTYFGAGDVSSMVNTLSSLSDATKKAKDATDKAKKDKDSGKENQPLQKTYERFKSIDEKLPEDSRLKKVMKVVEPFFIGAGAFFVGSTIINKQFVPYLASISKGMVKKAITAGVEFAQKTEQSKLGLFGKIKKAVVTSISNRYNKKYPEIIKDGVVQIKDEAVKAKEIEEFTGKLLGAGWDAVSVVLASCYGLYKVKKARESEAAEKDNYEFNKVGDSEIDEDEEDDKVEEGSSSISSEDEDEEKSVRKSKESDKSDNNEEESEDEE